MNDLDRIRTRARRRALGHYEALRHVGAGRGLFLQHDYDIANSSGAGVRSDMNNAFGAIVTWNSGATAPSTTFARMRWADTTAGVVKRRNAANSGWIVESTDDESFVLSRSSNTMLDVSDKGKTIRATASFTQTFDAVATLTDGWEVDFRVDAGAAITFDPNSSEQIDGAATLTVPGPASFRIKCNGSALYTVGYATPWNTTQALGDGATTNWDASSGAIATWTMGGSRTLAAPTNLKAGGRYVLIITQDATGGRAVTWNSVFKNAAGSMPQPNQQAGAVTAFTFTSPDGTNLRLETNEAKVLLAAATASSSATLDFTNLSGFAAYELEFEMVRPATDGQTLQLQVSDDNGSSWKSGESDYGYTYTRTFSSASIQNNSASSAVNVLDAVSNNASWGVSGVVRAHALSQSSSGKTFTWLVGAFLNDGNPWSSNGAGMHLAASAAVNGVRVKFGSGNIAAGTIRCYGIRG